MSFDFGSLNPLFLRKYTEGVQIKRECKSKSIIILGQILFFHLLNLTDMKTTIKGTNDMSYTWVTTER